MATLVPENVIAALRSSNQLAIFVRVDSTPPLRLWFGVGDFPIGFDAIDEDGVEYRGAGELTGIPTLEILVNGTSDAVDFTISGVDPDTAAATIASLPPIRGKAVHIGITCLDEYFQPLSSIIPLWSGVAARTIESRSPAEGGQNGTISLSLSVVAGENTRSRRSSSIWSEAQQIEVSRALRDGTPSEGLPDDKFCSQTGRIARGVVPTWPRYN